jgi:hypothetical protein
VEGDEQAVVRPSEDETGTNLWDDTCYAVDGCLVELDGRCEHGYESWLLMLGMI